MTPNNLGYPLQVSDTVRVDKGPQIKEGIANKATLDNKVTAGHYQIGMNDAFGTKIQKGKKFSYVDWLAPDEEHVYSVYQHDGERYQLVRRYKTEAAAIAAAEKLGG